MKEQGKDDAPHLVPPRWTVGWNQRYGQFIAKHWAFFADEERAQKFYESLNEDSPGFKRPFYPGDEEHLGAGQSDLIHQLRQKTIRYRQICAGDQK